MTMELYRTDRAAAPACRTRAAGVAAALLAAMIGLTSPATGAPAVGDAYSYRLVNGYNKEVRGTVHYQVARVEPDRITVSVSPDNSEAGWAHTETYTLEGNWLRHLVENHGTAREYEFATAYPAYAFPLDPGKSWSMRVKAIVPGTGEHRSVRVDGQVIGTERISVPAGEFDTVKIKRTVYPGDKTFTRLETQITEFDWYAPALGRPVRTERRSVWTDMGLCGMGGRCDFYGNWDIYELIKAPIARR